MNANSRTRAEAVELVSELRSANEICDDNGIRFSRACRGCGCASPSVRYASVKCGHAVCRGCADSTTCPVPDCAKPTTFVRLIDNERHCGICMSDCPRFLDVFSRCGHSICSACCGQMLLNEEDPNQRSATPLSCPLCRTVSIPFSLVEEADGDLPPAAFPTLTRGFVLFEEARRRAAEKMREVWKMRNTKFNYDIVSAYNMQAPLRLFVSSRN